MLSEMQGEADAIGAGLKRPIGGGLVGAMEIIDVCTPVHPSIANPQTGDAWDECSHAHGYKTDAEAGM